MKDLASPKKAAATQRGVIEHARQGEDAEDRGAESDVTARGEDEGSDVPPDDDDDSRGG